MTKTKKAHLVKASVLNAGSDEKGANFYVIAATAPEVNKNSVLASFKCEACATHFSALKGTQPFCVTCGSEEVDVDQGEGALSAEDLAEDEDLANVECSACGTHNIVTLQTASALGTKMHCITCGSEIEYMPPSDGVGEVDEEVEDDVADYEVTAEGDDATEMDDAELTLTDDLEGSEEKSEAAAEEDESEDTESAESDKETKEEGSAKGKKAATASDDAGKVDSPAPPASGVKSDDSKDTTIAEGVKAPEAAATEDDAEGEDEEVDTEEVDEDVEIDEEEATLASLVQGELSLERIGNRLIASIGGIPVAHLTRETAGNNSGVFATTAFPNAIKHTARKVGPEKALAHYNFQLASVKIPVPEMVQTRVTAGVEKAQQEIASKIKDVRADMQQALSIVAAGLNKGWFKGMHHVLKDALRQELSAAGFSNPNRLLDKVFAQYSAPYHKALFEKAAEIMAKDVSFRNELAEAIGDMNPQMSDEEDDVDEDEENQDVEARLEGANLRRTRSYETSSLAVDDVHSTVVELRSRNNGRIF